MKLKNSFAVILSAFMMLSSVSVSASAETVTYVLEDDVAPAYEYANYVSNSLSISSGTAQCSSDCTASSEIVSISVEQTLQTYWGLWIWNDVDGASWSKTSSGRSISLASSKSGLSSGKYRVKSVFTLTSSSGKSETITIYSEEKTIS